MAVASRTAIAATGAALSLLSGTAGPGVATSAARAAMVQKLSTCKEDDAEPAPLEFAISPTGLAIDAGTGRGDTLVRYYVGAIVGAIVIIVAFGVVSLICAAIHQRVTDPEAEARRWTCCGVGIFAFRSLAKARFPSVCAFPLMFFSQPLAQACVTCLRDGSVGARIVGAVGFGVLFLAFCFIGYIAGVGSDCGWNLFPAAFRDAAEVDQKKAAEQVLKFEQEVQRTNRSKYAQLPKNDGTTPGTCFERYVEGVYGVWFNARKKHETMEFKQYDALPLDSFVVEPPQVVAIDNVTTKKIKGKKKFTTNSLWLQRAGAFFDSYTQRWKSFMLVEFLFSVALGVLEAGMIWIGCRTVAWVFLALFVFFWLIVTFMRLFATRINRIFCFFGATFLLIAAICIVLPNVVFDSSDERQQEFVVRFTTAAIYVSMAQAVVLTLIDVARFCTEEEDPLSDDDDDDRDDGDAQEMAEQKFTDADIVGPPAQVPSSGAAAKTAPADGGGGSDAFSDNNDHGASPPLPAAEAAGPGTVQQKTNPMSDLSPLAPSGAGAGRPPTSKPSAAPAAAAAYQEDAGDLSDIL